MGNRPDTRGTAFVVYEDIYDAKNAVDHLSGFNVCNRYLVVLYYQMSKMRRRQDNKRKREDIEDMQREMQKMKEAEEAAAAGGAQVAK